MTVPDIVQSTLDGEEVSARVSLGGEDELFITPSSTIVYRAEGLLSDESVEEFPHDADRLALSEGRRKTTFALEYSLDGSRKFSVPSSRTEDVLHPVVAGLLSGNGITDPGETVVRTYRFSELTLILTSARLVKHVGEAVWDGDYEQYHFEDVTNLSFEDGSVATQVVLEVDGRQQRIKAPNEDAPDLRERLERALFEYHDVDSLRALNEAVGEEDADEERDRSEDASVAFGDGVAPLDTSSSDDSASEPAESSSDPLADHGTGGPTDADGETDAGRVGRIDDAEPRSDSRGGSGDSAADGPSADRVDRSFEDSGFEPATKNADPEVLERLDALEAAVQRQHELIEEQRRTIEQLITELRQGR